jgi:uncharacterized membrane protein
MNKQEFLSLLAQELSGLPGKDVTDRLAFYDEMIDDRIEEGLSEEDAVDEMGPVDEVAAQILEEIPLSRLVRERVRPKRRLRAWEILLLILGSPLWLSLLLAAGAVLLAVYVVIWALVGCLWAVAVAVFVSSLGCLAAGGLFLLRHEVPRGLAALGAGLALVGLSIFLFSLCRGASRGVVALTRAFKSLFVRKEAAA